MPNKGELNFFIFLCILFSFVFRQNRHSEAESLVCALGMLFLGRQSRPLYAVFWLLWGFASKAQTKPLFPCSLASSCPHVKQSYSSGHGSQGTPLPLSELWVLYNRSCVSKHLYGSQCRCLKFRV